MESLKPPASLMASIDAAYERLFDTLDSFDDDAWRASSLLPGWTRAHVVAHLNDNANRFAAAVEGVARGSVGPVYASDEARDGAIEEGAREPGEELLAESGESQKRWHSVFRGLDEKALATEVERVPDSPRRFRVADMPLMREREIELHHCDLDAGYGPEAWPREFVGRLLTDLLANMGQRADLTLVATDTGERHDLGDGGPEVRGTAARLAWWLARQDPSRLEADGEVPDLGPWPPQPR